MMPQTQTTTAEPRASSRLGMRIALISLMALAAATAVAGTWVFFDELAGNPSPVVPWKCEACDHEFRATVPLHVADQTTIPCTKCGKPAHRLMPMRCEECGKAFNYQPAGRTTPNFTCPHCKSAKVKPAT